MARKLYPDQYEDSSIPKKRSTLGWIAWLLFFAPGIVIMWWEYMFPPRGQVYATGRRYRNRIVQVIYTIGFYVVVLLFLFFILLPPHKK
ncbi:MAG TPA: hypothetical protein VGU72_04140 [Beijerinckiaceae bacterium]|jgi:ABC-type Fe3+ transport system permease subunit|nr:hypothetical protein [Beijerinckiaceae bacterium]